MIDLFGNEIKEDVLLRDKYIEPPFTVLDTKQGSWQDRKRLWQSKGIKSEVGRDATVIHMDSKSKENNTTNYTSIFDPALCEVIYRWFTPESGNILDPFAGGSVRGIVANYLGYNYTGIELRPEQVESNEEQAMNILPVNRQPKWYVGDSDKILDGEWLKKFDTIFSCPPYMDLEVYSDLPDDLSTLSDTEFIEKYESIIFKSCKLLKDEGYAIFVVGDVRDKKTGFYKDFITITKMAFYKAGLKLYNEAILLNPVASASMRADKQFSAGKKLVKIHQNILVFKK